MLHCQRPKKAKFISTCATRCHYLKGHSVSLYYFLSKDRPTLFAISETIRNCLKYLIEIYRLPLVFKQVCFFLNEEIRIMQLNCATLKWLNSRFNQKLWQHFTCVGCTDIFKAASWPVVLNQGESSPWGKLLGFQGELFAGAAFSLIPLRIWEIFMKKGQNLTLFSLFDPNFRVPFEKS